MRSDGPVTGPLVALTPALHPDLAGLAARLPGTRLTVDQDAGADVAVVATELELRRWLGRGAAVIAVSSDLEERCALLDAGATTATERCGSSELAARVAAVLRRLPGAPHAGAAA